VKVDVDKRGVMQYPSDGSWYWGKAGVVGKRESALRFGLTERERGFRVGGRILILSNEGLREVLPEKKKGKLEGRICLLGKPWAGLGFSINEGGRHMGDVEGQR